MPANSETTPAPELWLRFVSPTERRAVVGMDMIQKVLEVKGFRVDHSDFQIINKREVKRPINPKFKEGPKETVILEERVNINTAFKYLRQLGAKAKQNPENVLLVQIERIKGEAIAYPLILPGLFDQDEDVLITGITQTVLTQLTAKPDPNFEKIPSVFADDEATLNDLLSRAKRKKGMQSTARELLNIQGFKPEVLDKINIVAQAKPDKVTDAEMVNLILLSDIYSRYQPILTQFWSDVTRKASPVPVLAKQFSQLMYGLPLAGVLTKLKPFLDPEKTYKTFESLFGAIFQCLAGMENKHFEGDPRLYNPQTLAATVKGIVVIGRSQLDPGLWQKCICFFSPDDERSDNQQSVAQLAKIADKIISNVEKEAAHSSQSLQDIFDTSNTRRYLLNTPVQFKNLSDEASGLLTQNLAKRWGYRAEDSANPLELFDESQLPIPKFHRSLKTIGTIYGYTLFQRLKQSTATFFEPGFPSLSQRFGEEFFEICYYQCVASLDLPVSRTQLAHWLKSRGLVKSLEGLGYDPKAPDEPLDPWITDGILAGSGESVIPTEFGPTDLANAFEESQTQFLSFFKKLKNHSFDGEEDLNPATQLLKIFRTGVYDIDSKAFRDSVNSSYLKEEIEEVIQNTANELKTELQAQAKGSKLVLMLPIALKGIFFLTHRFRVRGESQMLQVHLLVTGQPKTAQLEGIHKQFSTGLSRFLKDNQDPYRVGLVQSTQMLKEYHKSSQDYLRFLGLLFFDRFLEGYHNRESEHGALAPKHIKKAADRSKMVIGQAKGVNISKLLNFADPKLQREAMPMTNQSLSQFRQAVFYHHNSSKNLGLIIKKTHKLINLFGRFSASMKETAEYQQLETLYLNYMTFLGLPPGKWTDRLMTDLGELTLDIKKIVDASEGMDSPGARLRKEWIDRNPNDENILRPHKIFSSERVKSDNIIFELTQARDLHSSLGTKKYIIFAPEKAKKGQIEHIQEILEFLQANYPKALIYLEDAYLDDEDREILAQGINPSNFFDSSKL